MNTIDILKTHNAWRRGDDTRTQCELGFSVTELGIAIDDAVRAISERDKLLAELAQERERGRKMEAAKQPDVTLLLELLSHARCNTCDGSGGLYDNHGHPHQCQWCHDRSTALAAYRKGGEV